MYWPIFCGVGSTHSLSHYKWELDLPIKTLLHVPSFFPLSSQIHQSGVCVWWQKMVDFMCHSKNTLSCKLGLGLHCNSPSPLCVLSQIQKKRIVSVTHSKILHDTYSSSWHYPIILRLVHASRHGPLSRYNVTQCCPPSGGGGGTCMYAVGRTHSIWMNTSHK